MPSCFQLIKRGETEPSILQDVDVEMWNHFKGGEPKGNDQWYHNWYNNIGLSLATGQSFSDIAKGYADSPKMLNIVEYLEERYTTYAWREFK